MSRKDFAKYVHKYHSTKSPLRPLQQTETYTLVQMQNGPLI